MSAKTVPEVTHTKRSKKRIACYIAIILLVVLVCSFPASWLLNWIAGAQKWGFASAGDLRENITVNIPNVEKATHVKAWIRSASPYYTKNLNETKGFVSLPTSLMFETHWNNATLHVIYAQYRTATGNFDNSTFTQNQLYELETKEYFLDLTELDVLTYTINWTITGRSN